MLWEAPLARGAVRLSHAKLSLANTSLYWERKILSFVLIPFEIKGETRITRGFPAQRWQICGHVEWRKGNHHYIAVLLTRQKGFCRPILIPLQWGHPQIPFPAGFPAPLRGNKQTSRAGTPPQHHAMEKTRSTHCAKRAVWIPHWIPSGMMLELHCVTQPGIWACFSLSNESPDSFSSPHFNSNKQRDPDTNPAAVSGYICICLQLLSFN